MSDCRRCASLERTIAEAVALLPDGSMRARMLSAIPGVEVPGYKETLMGAPKCPICRRAKYLPPDGIYRCFECDT